MWEQYINATSIDQVIELLAKHHRDARLINGGTDLMIEIERKARAPKVVIDVSRIPGLDEIRFDDGVFHLGAGVTHNQVVGDARLRAHAFPLVSRVLASGRAANSQSRNDCRQSYHRVAGE